MRVSWTYGRGLVALSTVILVIQGAGPANGQLGSSTDQNQAYTPSLVGAPPSTAWPPTGNVGPRYAGAQPSAASAQPNGSVAQIQQTAGAQGAEPRYTAMAFIHAPNEEVEVPAGPPVAEVAPVESPVVADIPSPALDGGTPVDCNCQSAAGTSYRQTTPATYHAGYGGPGYGGYGGAIGYNTFDPGRCIGPRHGGYLGCQQSCGSRWYGGLYGLLMERDDSDGLPLAFATGAGNAPPYFPADGEINMTTSDIDVGFQGGFEARVGYLFGGAGGSSHGCQPCPGTCGCGPSFAMEGVYWGIFEDDAGSQISDITGDGVRLFGMIDFDDLEWFDGAGWRPVNVFYDSGVPTQDNTAPYDVEVRSLTARSTFSANNVELNLVRLPVLGGIAACGACQPRLEVGTLLGVRFLRLDEEFYFRSDFERMDTNVLGNVAYNAEVDNNLVGFQLGCNSIYRLGGTGRWSIHCDTAVGVYGNKIEARQWINGARFANNSQAFDVTTEKNTFSMLGELRVGGSFQYSSNWRVYGGWRVVGVSGIARSVDQIPTVFNTPAQAGRIASNGSMVLHGLQTGVEFTY